MNLLVRLLLLSITILLASCGGNKSVKKGEIDFGKASDINVQLAVGYLQRNQLEAAQTKLEKAIDQNPENIEANKLFAFLMSKLGEDDKAEDYYQDALDLDSKDPELHNSYGTFLCKLDRIDDALEEFKTAYTHPFYETPYMALGNAGTCLLKIERYVEAESLLRKALTKEPRLSGALISMADIGIRTGKFLMARAYIQRYHGINKPTAESLWIQVQAEKALGAKKHYMKYARQLLKEYPDSHEAGWLEEQAINERNQAR